MEAQKKKMSKGKKILIIVLCNIAFLLVVVVTVGAVALNKYCHVNEIRS